MATAEKEPRTEKNIDGYGAPPIPWEKVRNRLEQGLTQGPGDGGPQRYTNWLATTDADGSPHVMPLGTLWIDGAFYFNAGAATRKAKNIARDPRCAITVATDDFDLVVKGTATQVTDRAKVERIAEAFRAQGWPTAVSVDAPTLVADFSAPSAGPPPWNVYEVIPQTVFALGTSEPFGAERWQF